VLGACTVVRHVLLSQCYGSSVTFYNSIFSLGLAEVAKDLGFVSYFFSAGHEADKFGFGS